MAAPWLLSLGSTTNPLYSWGSTVWRGGRVGRRQPPAKRLQGQNLCPGFESRPLRHAPLAQVDRASDYESEGQRFESSRAHHPNRALPPQRTRLALVRIRPTRGGLSTRAGTSSPTRSRLRPRG